MIKVTFDTNCIINLLDYKSKTRTSYEEIAEIIRYAMEGGVNIAITTRVEYDISKDKQKSRKQHLLEQINMFPVIGTGARFGFSKYGKGDFYVGKEYQSITEELVKIIFPGLNKGDRRFKNKVSDVDHLAGHIHAKRDIFVTDDKVLLRKSKIIKAHFGTDILTPKDCWQTITSKHKPLPLVKMFRERWEEYINFLTEAAQRELQKKDEEKYRYLREHFIRTFPKIKTPLARFRLKMRSQEVGDQLYFRQSDLSSLKRDINPFKKYYSRPILKKTIEDLKRFWPRGDYEFSEWVHIGMEDKRDMLLEYEGYLE